MAPMIDIDEAIQIAAQNGGIGTITGKHNAPVAHIVTDSRMRQLIDAEVCRQELPDWVEPGKRKPTRGERRHRAREREHRARQAEAHRRAEITRQDNANRNRKRASKAGRGSVIGESVADLQREMNRQMFGAGLTRR